MTPKQERFVAEYLVNGNNASAAYRAAYDAGRMSAAAVNVAACKLLKNPKVWLRLDSMRNSAAALAVIDEARTLQVMNDVAHFDLADLYDELGNLLPVHRMPKAARMGITAIKVRRIPGTEGVVEEVRILNRAVALDALAKVRGLYGRMALPVLAAAGTLAEQGRAVIEALAAGTLAPVAAANALQAIAAQAKVVETNELLKRVEALEAART